MLNKKDIGFLFAMLKMCDDIESYKNEFGSVEAILNKRSGINAVLMNLSQLGEFAGRISDDAKTEFTSIDWKHIKGLRNIIVHDYFGVDPVKIFTILRDEMPGLAKALMDILSELASSGKIDRGLIQAANTDMTALRINLPD